MVLAAALLAGCNKEDSKAAAPQVADPTLVTPAPELLAQLKLADVSSQTLAKPCAFPAISISTSSV